MALIKAFAALRPLPEVAGRVASVPYDVVDASEARVLAKGCPHSFLHIIRPEIDLNPGIDEYDSAVYNKGAENLHCFAMGDYSCQEVAPALYLYRLRMGEHEQIGIYGLVSVEEYKRGIILKHENTRPPKVADRTKHILAQRAHAEPVILMFRDDASVTSLVTEATEGEPLFDFTAEDGIQHTIWKFSDHEPVLEAFADVSALYIGDGHHRCEAAWQAWSEQRLPDSDFFPAVCFPVSNMYIMPYNRVVRVPDVRELIEKIGSLGVLEKASGREVPAARGEVSLYADGAWHTITLPPTRRSGVADGLDVARLGEFILEPFLGIIDQRTDPNITFIGGSRGVEGLVNHVDQTPGTVAFSMFETSMDQLLDVSDAGELMPPKSTWFEPKLRSGLLIHRF
ncbi:MAG: DUF1015 family protein [Bacteroidetes bacterium]|nr:DUF1015 family protein [Bacteroidota bacterium]